MAIENHLGVCTVGDRVAAADLSSAQYTLVQLDADGKVAAPTGQGVKCFGVLQNAPAAGEVAEVMVFGISRVVSSGAISLGATGNVLTAAGTSGKIGAATSGDYVAGFLYDADAGADGTYASMFVTPSQVPLA